MHLSHLLLCVCLVWSGFSAPLNFIQEYLQQTSQTKLLGSSFGVPGVDQTFDYVIIGGGVAGLTIATRLAEAQNSVAVIEAGSFYELDNGNLSQIPSDDVFYTSAAPEQTSIQPLVDWGFITQPQLGLLNRTIHYTQGKCFGGGSARNYMAYHRGSTGSYQTWADQVGDQSWTFDRVLPYFQKSVKFTPPNIETLGLGADVNYDPSAFSASGGPLHVSYSNYYQPLSSGLIKGLQSIGLANIPGLNSGKLIGYAHGTATIDPQAETRSSSESSFLQEALGKTTLQVYQHTLARNIIFGANKTATGVNVTTGSFPSSGSRTYVLSARKEVILSAGAFHSPQVLMVSGIGPRTTLEKYNIPVISDLPGVGQGLQDQPLFALVYNVSVTTSSSLSNATYAAAALKDYLSDQTGPLTNPNYNEVGWEKLPASSRANLSASTLADLSQFPADWPEIEYVTLARDLTGTITAPGQYATFGVALVAPLSRGAVTITSADTMDRPLISPGWLTSTTDVEVGVQAFKRARKVAEASGIVISETLPGLAVQSDEDIEKYIREGTVPIHHASATCKMGKRNDTMAVADSTGRVFGVSNLRVADISAFPLLPPGHPQATVYMLAEKIAAQILSGVV